MEYIFTRANNFNIKVFLVAIFISLFINLAVILFYGYTINNVKPKELVSKEPKIKFLEIKEKVKKDIKSKKRQKTLNKSEKKLIKKPVGEILSKKPVVPLASPIIPETVQISEKEISLPEENSITGNLASDEINIGKELEYKPVLKGEFNPSFGTKLSKFDETAFGPASGRLIVYKPPPPTIKTALPPPPKVKVKLWINSDGTVDKVDIIYPKALGDIKLKQIIEEYVLSWKFNSISSKEKQWAITTIRFQSKK